MAQLIKSHFTSLIFSFGFELGWSSQNYTDFGIVDYPMQILVEVANLENSYGLSFIKFDHY